MATKGVVEITSKQKKSAKRKPSRAKPKEIQAAGPKPRVRTKKPEPTNIERLQKVQVRIYRALPGIVRALIVKAREGSYLHARCLFEVARLAELHVPAESANEPWARQLLEELRKIPVPDGHHEVKEVNPSSFEATTKVSTANEGEPLEWERGTDQP